MAEKVMYGSAIFKDAQGHMVKLPGFTKNDIAKLQSYITKTDENTAKIASINQGQRMLAYKDYYTDDTHKDEMAVGVFYVVPFNAKDEFLEFDPDTGKPKSPQPVGSTTDLTVAYTQLVYKNSADQINKLGRQDTQMSFADMAKLSATQTFTGDNTFEKDITMSATQNVDTLGGDKLATAKFVRELADKKINDAGHLTGTFSQTGEPTEDQLVVNQIAFYKAVDML